MTKNQPEDSKLLPLPYELVNRLKEASSKNGLSISLYATEVLEAGLELDKMGASAKEAVKNFHMTELNKSAGVMNIPRSSFNHILEILTVKQFNELKQFFTESGQWFGEYIKSKIKTSELPSFLQKELKTSWNLDEIDIKGDDELLINFASFSMTEKCTQLLLNYLCGILHSLGYKQTENDHLRGMGSLKFMKKPGT